MRVHTLTAAVADVYIAISFSFILHGKRTGFYGYVQVSLPYPKNTGATDGEYSTNHIITRLVLYIIH